MTRVDFYILPDQDEARRLVYLCRVADKAFRMGHRVWIQVGRGRADALDERLWTFSQGSFLPHERADSPDAADCPIVIGEDSEPDPDRALLINDDATIPAFADRVERIAEIVNQAEDTRRRGREHYSAYRDRGFDLHYHRLEQG